MGQFNFGPAKSQDIPNKLDKASVVNNLTTTEEGYALDARQGKALSDQIGTLNDKIANLFTVSVSKSLESNASDIIAYPTGYDRSNCIIVSVYITASNNKYYNGEAQAVLVSSGVQLINKSSVTATVTAHLVKIS